MDKKAESIEVLDMLLSTINPNISPEWFARVEDARSAFADLIESVEILLYGDWEDGVYFYNGYKISELQDEMTLVAKAIARVRGQS